MKQYQRRELHQRIGHTWSFNRYGLIRGIEMVYKIKRHIMDGWIPLSDKIERMLDIDCELNPDDDSRRLIVSHPIIPMDFTKILIFTKD